MPNCAAAIICGRFSRPVSTRRARADPSAASGSIWLRRTETRANSAPTKKPLPSTSRAAKSSCRALNRGSPRPAGTRPASSAVRRRRRRPHDADAFARWWATSRTRSCQPTAPVPAGQLRRCHRVRGCGRGGRRRGPPPSRTGPPARRARYGAAGRHGSRRRRPRRGGPPGRARRGRARGRSCSSCSSRTSPTSSSTMSSRVTTPAVPPYSSTTTAMGASLRNRASRGCTGSVSGTSSTGAAMSETRVRSRSCARDGERVLEMGGAGDLVQPVARRRGSGRGRWRG